MFKKMKGQLVSVASAARGNLGKIGAGATAFLAAPMAMAATTPGAAIAAELAGGEADMGLVFAAVAILIGVLLVWAYVRRSAK